MNNDEEIKKLKEKIKVLENKIIKMESAFELQIRNREKRIEELEKNNDLLMGTALKQSEENENLKNKLKEGLKQKKD